MPNRYWRVSDDGLMRISEEESRTLVAHGWQFEDLPDDAGNIDVIVSRQTLTTYTKAGVRSAIMAQLRQPADD